MRRHALRAGLIVVLLGVIAPPASAGYKRSAGTARPASPQPQQQPAAPPVDRSASAKARLDGTNANTEAARTAGALTGLTAKLRKEKLEPTAEWKQSQEAVSKAQSEHDAAKRAVMAKLKSDPAYQAILADRIKAQSEYDALPPDAPYEDRARIAKTMMAGADAAMNMESTALTSDADATKAKAAMEAANAKQAEVAAAFDATLPNIPEWATASKAAEDAKQKVTDAKKALTGALAQEAQAERNRQRTAQGR